MAKISLLESAKTLFLRNLDRLEGDDLRDFCDWTQDVLDETQYGSKEHSHGGIQHSHSDPAMDKLQSIIEDLRSKLPLNAMAPDEQTYIPHGEKEEGYTPENTVHVDGFLYDDDEVDRLCDEGKMSRAVCSDCGSRNTTLLNFVSHSMSVPQLQFTFNTALPDLTGKRVVDVGSRLGAVLYGGYLFSKAAKLTGVEMSDYFCDITNSMLAQRKMTNRAEVVHGDIRDHAALLKSADVVVLNNVFEFFFEHEKQAAFWTFLRTNITKKDAYIVSVPALEESVRSAAASVNLQQWVTKVKLDYGEHSEDPENDVNNVHVYRVN